MIDPKRAALVSAFYQYGLPGMTLVAHPPKRPLVYRCECGAPISRTKLRCRACQVKAIVDLALQVTDNDLRQTMFEKLDPGIREDVLKAFREQFTEDGAAQ